MAVLPQGTVTFLFTDIEGSTKLVQELGPRYRDVLETHQALLRDAFRAGVEVGTEGDSFFVVFASATDAVAAAVDGQRALAGQAWPDGHRVRVRMGLHTGQASLGAGAYVGFDVHRAARIAAAGSGGQVLLSESMHALVSRDLPDGVTIRDLGTHRLKDLAVPERMFQLVVSGLDAEFPALRTVEGGRTNLPPQLTSFVGRERELAELQALARAHRLVTVIGSGGTGKTRLMVQTAAELVGEQPDGVWLVELAPISDPDLIMQAVARGLGISDSPGRPLGETVIDFLRTKSLLLLIDNCEHLIVNVAELAEQVLAACPAISFMASSREALGVAGERVFQVPSLSLPDAVVEADEHAEADDGWFADVGAAEAVRLFVDRATAVLPSFSLTPSDAPAVVEICRRLDGIPLAIELAAARVPLLSVQEIAQRLGDRFRLLTGGRRTALPRQQTLQALIDWSWDLLTDDERMLLRRLSVFAGGCTVEAAVDVARLPDEVTGAGDPSLDMLEVVGRLVGRSLVVVDRSGSTRYRLLETIRQYARDRLVAAGETSALRNQHLAFYLRLALEAEPALVGPDMVAWLARLDAEADNLRTALDWAFEEDPFSAMRLSVALAVYWRSRSLAEGLAYLRRAAELARSLPASSREPAGERTMLVARVLALAANASWMAGSASAGLRWAEASLHIAREVGDAQTLAEALNAMAMTTMFCGQFEGVIDWAEEAVVLAETIDAWSAIALTAATLSQWAVERGAQAEAEARLATATAAAERSGNPFAIAFTAMSRGRVDGFGGRLEDARRWFAKAIESYEQLGRDPGLVITRSNFAHALRSNGAIDEAATLYRQTLHAWQHIGNRGAIANQLESVAFLAMAKEDHLRAAQLLAAAEAIREQANAPMMPHERAEYDAAVAALHELLDAAPLESAWADGRRLTTDEAVTLALGAL
jgi:predicted ATPase/class 3 adenylate cyclase